MGRNNYNALAPFYDACSRIVFGHHLETVQARLLPAVLPDSNILIIGGGTGKILELLAQQNKKIRKIVYVDASRKMIEKAQHRLPLPFPVEFVCLYAEDYMTTEKFDTVITPFFFDNFPPDKIALLFTKIDKLLIYNGLWLYVDFFIQKPTAPLWQKILLRFMYFFFYLTVQIETRELTEMNRYFAAHYEKLETIDGCRHFIRGLLFRKLPKPNS